MQITFKQYLFELDQGDLDLLNQHKTKLDKNKEFNQPAVDFRNEMTKDRDIKAGIKSLEGEPSKGDVIQIKTKKYIVIKRSNGGFHLKELGGNKSEIILPHRYKYKQVDKTPLGKNIYKLYK